MKNNIKKVKDFVVSDAKAYFKPLTFITRLLKKALIKALKNNKRR